MEWETLRLLKRDINRTISQKYEQYVRLDVKKEEIKIIRYQVGLKT